MMGNNCNYQMFELKEKNLLHSNQVSDQVQIVLELRNKAKSFRKIMSARPLENGGIIDIKAYNA